MDENLAAADRIDEVDITPPIAEKKQNGFIQSAKNAINTIKGKDLETKIEEFSSEITMVIEGISDDQERLDKTNQQLKDKLQALDERITAIERTVGKKAVGITIVRQLTWLAGIVSVAIIIVSIVRLLG